jgi:ABC-2 type transport system ATP-binding protein
MELVINGLSKTYANGVKALDNVTLTIPTGMFGLLGPNGAGKSSLMRILATLQEADAGTVMLGNIDVLQVTRTRCARCSATCPRSSACTRG